MTAPAAVSAPAFAEATRTFARIGCLSFGGPAGQIALMHRILVEDKKWVSEAQFLNALNYCMVLPGPEAQQLATYIGWLLHGTRGGVVAGGLFILPGLAVMLVLSALYARFQSLPMVDGLFFGLKAAVLAIVAEALLRIGRRALKSDLHRLTALAAFLALALFRLPFPLVILTAGVIGWLGARRFAAGRAVAVPAAEAAQALPTRKPTGPLRVLALWGGLWAAPVLVAFAVAGPNGLATQLALFFSKMAVVTFGGAYAVLSYVADAAVGTFHWLAPGGMIDGLALAETTPGPLILVLAFVGFQAGYRDSALGGMGGGLMGALITMWVTFIPSFLWIFLGAPYVEKLRGHAGLAGALSAITAAVTGVIANLALWFGLHVLFRRVIPLAAGPFHVDWPEWTSLDPAALTLAVIAALALFRFRCGIVTTLTLCGALGLVWRLTAG